MKRRQLLSGLTTAALATATGCQQLDGVLSSSGVKSIEWINLDVLRIHFKKDHEMDGFVIMHKLDDDPTSDDIVTQKAPNYSGPRDVRLVDHVRSSDRKYPSRKFKIVGYEGDFGYVSIIGEKTGSFGFKIPKGIMPRTNWRNNS